MSADATPFRTRSPHSPTGRVSVSTLMEQWVNARQRTFLAEHGASNTPPDVEDYWTELALGTRLAHEVTAGRWVTVAQLLRTGGVSHWDELGAALDVTGAEALAGFTSWLTNQVALYRSTGIGLTEAEAFALVRLADAVPGGAR